MKRHHVREYERKGRKVSDYYRGKGAGRPGDEVHGRFSEVYERGGPSTELTSEEREKLPDEAFAIQAPQKSERGYPVPTEAELQKYLGWSPEKAEVGGKRHALNALQRVDQHGTDHERNVVGEMVQRRYPTVFHRYAVNRWG